MPSEAPEEVPQVMEEMIPQVSVKTQKATATLPSDGRAVGQLLPRMITGLRPPWIQGVGARPFVSAHGGRLFPWEGHLIRHGFAMPPSPEGEGTTSQAQPAAVPAPLKWEPRLPRLCRNPLPPLSGEVPRRGGEVPRHGGCCTKGNLHK